MEGQFDPQEGITVCQNYVVGKKYIQTIVAHELIHAYDFCRVDLHLNNCLHVACAEIRASNLSGECHWKKEIRRGNFAVSQHHFDCVRRRALLSLSKHPHCAVQADQFVEKAWQACSNDIEPYDFIP